MGNRKNNPTFRKVSAGVEIFRRSSTRKLPKKMKKNFRRWSQRGQMSNEKLRRRNVGLFFRLSLNRKNNPTFRKVSAGVEIFRRSSTRKLPEKMKKNFRR